MLSGLCCLCGMLLNVVFSPMVVSDQAIPLSWNPPSQQGFSVVNTSPTAYGVRVYPQLFRRQHSVPQHTVYRRHHSLRQLILTSTWCSSTYVDVNME